MAERDPIELIKGQLIRADDMAGLHPDHENFRHWHSETKTILEKVFSSKSVHYQSFLALRFREMSVHAFASTEIEKINAVRYKRDLENTRNILQSAIKELALDRTLFKKIQTTPETVEVSLEGEYFVSSGIQESELIQAIKSAFEGSGLTPILGLDGSQKGELLRQRIDRIKGAKFGIYDLSALGSAPTLLELGAALGMGKQTILIHKKSSPLPEWLEQTNRIEYENVSDLIDKLKRKVHY
ncbi:MAG: hypothetical protein H6Q41_1484 [Deltaproteobacteria bacterium]|jgi:hypothetical protein|nr:hypothetical protein [Deltaproteobacteria bacterium]